MIFLAFTWQTWAEIERENRDSLETAMNIVAREWELDAMSSYKEDREPEWLDSRDAFLNESARALGITRSDLERQAVAGLVDWRESSQPGVYEVRHRDRITPIAYRRWGGRGNFEKHRETVRTAAANQP